MIITQISAFKKAVGLFPKSILLPFEKKYISSLAEKEMPTTKKAEVVAPAFLIGRGSQTRTDTGKAHKILSLARLPVPPYPHQISALIIYLVAAVNSFFMIIVIFLIVFSKF